MIGGRKAIIVNLPLDVNPSLVTSIVFGGPLEKIEIIQQTAHVLFLYAQDCQNYLNSTVNGVIFGHGGCRYLASVIASPEMNTTSGQVVAYMNKDITRCIRAIGVDECMTIERMREKAAYKNRDVDDIIVETTATGVSSSYHVLKTATNVSRSFESSYFASVIFAMQCSSRLR